MNDDEPIPTATTDADGTMLTIRLCDDDWYIIERRDHDGETWMEPVGRNAFAIRCSARISDADVEGNSAQMKHVASAIENRGEYHAKRCAVRVCGDLVEFWSPRNSERRGVVTLANADDIAAQIFTTLA